MKKIYSILTLLIFSAVLVGCSEDNENTTEPSLKVINANLDFDVNGGTGIIEFFSVQPVTATSSAEWCTVEVSGNKVNVTVAINPRIESRSAMITIRSGNKETEIPVYQSGDILDTTLVEENITFDLEGGETTYRLKSNWDIELSGFEDWITYTLEEDMLTLRVDPLPDGKKYRSCSFRLVTGIHDLTYTVTQMDRNIAGEWNCYINGGKTAYGTCVIESTETANRYKVTPTGSAYDGPYYITVKSTNVIINFNQILGPYASNPNENVVLCAYDATGTLTWDTSVEYAAPIAFSEDGNKIILKFGDNGTWSGYHVDGFYYSITSNGVPSGNGIAAIVDLVWESK